MGTQVCERQIAWQNAGRRILHHSGVRRQYAGTLQAAAACRRQYAGTLQAVPWCSAGGRRRQYAATPVSGRGIVKL